MSLVNNGKIMCWGSKSQAMLYHLYLGYNSIFFDYIYDPMSCHKPDWYPFSYGFDSAFFENAATNSTYFVVAIGSYFGYQRFKISNFLREKYNLRSIDIRHHTSFICPSSKYGLGIVQMPSSVINSFSLIGNDCIFNSNSTVDHECSIANGVHVMGGATITGRVKIGDYTSIGSNATILPDLSIGSRVIVGAGSVVTKSLPDNVIAYGNPARIITGSEKYFTLPSINAERYPKRFII